ncbi:MAG: DUF3800 domain-containing protein [Limisphaerales bacterium]
MSDLFNILKQPEPATPETHYIFVDEAGDPTIFGAKGRSLVATKGCSHYFILGKLTVEDPVATAEALTNLRERMKADPFFSTAESFKPERKRTALLFHAKDDLPEVRIKVFDLLRSFGSTLRFHAVVCDKEAVQNEEEARRAADPKYRYNPDHLYDRLTRSLFGKFHQIADRYQLCIAKRGNKNRNAALLQALEHAESDFEGTFGFSRGGIAAWTLIISNPETTCCLQAVDYFLWALQRFYEPQVHPATGEVTRQDRFLNALWDQMAEIHDIHFGPAQGTFFTKVNPLTLESRFPPFKPKRKKP